MVIFTIVFCYYRVQIIQLYEISPILFRTMKGCLLVQSNKKLCFWSKGVAVLQVLMLQISAPLEVQGDRTCEL